MEHDVYMSADFADLSSLTHFDVNTEELLTARVNTLGHAVCVVEWLSLLPSVATLH